ncbi:MAG: TonB-dependent receptor [Ignavibacteriae bacterium]|nr:TonB-dependent receptor [Ignavibacteriota bacterium]
MKYIIIILSLIISSNMLLSQIQKVKKKDTIEYKTSEIVVSALRYPERIIEVPLSISYISMHDFSFIKGIGIDEPLKTIPGVLAQSRAGGSDVRITIRGFGARGAGDRSNSGTSRGIKFFLNGIPQNEPDGRTSFDFLDFSLVDNIEVIRSNASAIWGNAAGGVVSISTMPGVKQSFLDFSLQGGSYGLKKLTVEAGSDMDFGFLNSSFSASSYDGWRQFSGSERYLFNLGLTSTLSKKTLLNLFLSAVSNKFNIPGPLTKTTFDNNPDSANSIYLGRKERRDNKAVQIGLNLEHNFDDNNSLSGMLFVNPKYLQRSERNTYRDFTRYHLGGNLNFKNKMEFEDSFSNTLLIGLDEQYQDGAILFYSLSPEGGRGSILKDNKREGANTAGAYIQDEIMYNDEMSAVFGLRYDEVTYYSENFFNRNFSEKKSYSKLTPKIALSYRFSGHHNIYLSYGGGIEVPAGNETDPSPFLGMDTIHLVNPLLDPIVSTTYEIGSKNIEPLDGSFINRLSYEIALYMIETTNDIIPYRGGKFYFTAGKTKKFGAEFGLGARFFKSLDINASLTYMNSKYKDYKIDSVHYDTTKAGLFADYSENKVAGIPDIIYNITLRYSPEWFKYAFLEMNFESVGKYFADDANQFTVPAYSVINLRLGTAEPISITNGLGINLYASVNNLTDSKYAASSFINPELEKGTGLPVYLEPGLPRNFVFGLSFEWK